MPAQSKSQQRLMGVAYAVKSGDMQLSDVDASYKDKVKELVDSMSLKDLKDFAETDHSDLPEEVSEGKIKLDLKRIMTRIMSALEFKTDPKARKELLDAIKDDLEDILPKHGYVLFEEESLEEDLSAVTPDMVGGMGDVVLPNGDTPGSGDVPAGKGKAKKKKKVLNLEEFIQEQEQIKPFAPEQGKGEKLGEGDYEVGPTVDPDAEMKERHQARSKAINVVTFDSFSKR